MLPLASNLKTCSTDRVSIGGIMYKSIASGISHAQTIGINLSVSGIGDSPRRSYTIIIRRPRSLVIYQQLIFHEMSAQCLHTQLVLTQLTHSRMVFSVCLYGVIPVFLRLVNHRLSKNKHLVIGAIHQTIIDKAHSLIEILFFEMLHGKRLATISICVYHSIITAVCIEHRLKQIQSSLEIAFSSLQLCILQNEVRVFRESFLTDIHQYASLVILLQNHSGSDGHTKYISRRLSQLKHLLNLGLSLMHTSLRHEFLNERQLHLFEQSGLYQRVVAYSFQLMQSLGTLSGLYVTGKQSSFYGCMGIIVYLIFSHSFKHGYGFIVLFKVHHSAHIVHTDAAQLIIDINIVGPFSMDSL